MYEYIDNVLGSYFSSAVECSEDEAISTLRKHLVDSPQLAEGLHTELQSALNNRDYSWKNVLAEHDVLFAENEEDARTYAKKILWDALFAE